MAVLGAGKLAREILPWLIGKTRVRVLYRSWQNAKDIVQQYPEVELVQYEDGDSGWIHKEAGLVIAAPLKSDEIEQWTRAQTVAFNICLDLRGEAASDPVTRPEAVIKLNELFAALRAERERLAGHVDAARAEIKQVVERQSHQAQFRPFGWEDLCA